jgi:hypothetical protein
MMTDFRTTQCGPVVVVQRLLDRHGIPAQAHHWSGDEESASFALALDTPFDEACALAQQYQPVLAALPGIHDLTRVSFGLFFKVDWAVYYVNTLTPVQRTDEWTVLAAEADRAARTLGFQHLDSAYLDRCIRALPPRWKLRTQPVPLQGVLS